jgi:hypothetical protein
MAVIGERQVTGGNGRESFRPERMDILDMEGFWLSDKFLIRAVITTFKLPCQS